MLSFKFVKRGDKLSKGYTVRLPWFVDQSVRRDVKVYMNDKKN